MTAALIVANSPSPVINLGLIKTGTTSLDTALRWSGHAACKWSSSVHLDDLAAFARADGPPSNSSSLERELHSCGALSDNPWWILFPSLMRRYPRVRYVLTSHTNCSTWLSSVDGLWDASFWSWSPSIHSFHRCVYGSVHFDAARFAARCAAHTRSVRLTAAAYGHRVLSLPLGMSDAAKWQALDSYLGTPGANVLARRRDHGDAFPRVRTPNSHKGVDHGSFLAAIKAAFT